jgi:hypothetical protein
VTDEYQLVMCAGEPLLAEAADRSFSLYFTEQEHIIPLPLDYDTVKRTYNHFRAEAPETSFRLEIRHRQVSDWKRIR